MLAPQLTYAVAAGAPALSAAQEDALDAAFDLVNRFRLIVTRLGTSEVLLDEIIEVTPGQDVFQGAIRDGVGGGVEGDGRSATICR